MTNATGRTALVVGSACSRSHAALTTAIVKGLGVENDQIVVADLDEEPWRDLVASGAALYAALDPGSPESWSELVVQFPSPDVLITSTRIDLADSSPVTSMDLEVYERYVRLNQTSVFLGAKAVLPSMVKAGRGSIVNVASIDALRGVAQWSPYVAANHAIVGLTRAIALEVASAGVRVNAVCASPNASIADDVPPAVVEHLLRQVPTKRLSTATEIANLVTFLASDAGSACTGAIMVADNGRLAGPAPSMTTTLSDTHTE